jgi:hypothetical protein
LSIVIVAAIPFWLLPEAGSMIAGVGVITVAVVRDS